MGRREPAIHYISADVVIVWSVFDRSRPSGLLAVLAIHQRLAERAMTKLHAMNSTRMQSVRGCLLLLLGMPVSLYGGDGIAQRMLNYTTLNSGECALLSTCVALFSLSAFFWMLQFVPGMPGMSRPMERWQKIVLVVVPLAVTLWTVFRLVVDR